MPLWKFENISTDSLSDKVLPSQTNYEIEQTNLEGNYCLYQDEFEWMSSKEVPLFSG